MNVLIAEDELLERKAMIKFLQIQFPDLKIVAEAENGRKAIELAKITKPDLLLMDINMPGINGLEAIEEIKAYLPDAQFIMITAHDSFAYAKQALSAGVRDYILKPSRKEETIKAIKSAQEAVWQKMRLKQQEKTQREELLMINLLYKQGAVLNLHKHMQVDASSGIIMIIKPAEGYVMEKVTENLKSWSNGYLIVYKQEYDCRWIVLALSKNNQLHLDMDVLRKRILHEYGKQVEIGIGKPKQVDENLQESYFEAMAMLQKSSDQEGRANRLNNFLTMIVTGDKTKTLEEFMVLIRNDTFKKEQLYYQVEHLLTIRNINGQGRTLHQLQTERDWYHYIEDCCDQFKVYNHSMNQIERAKQWLKDHYDEQFTLQEVAEHVHLSPAYFSNLFKITTGFSFVDYVTRLRMEKAMSLLIQKRYSLKEISYMVGYNDPNYFSRVFKKHYQVAPSQFQF
ncbi:response regulator [Shouchella xiaoxiensis]|nr:response regulator [Shouchella xiaoxiensis]